MRYIPMNEVEPGMSVAHDIYDTEGKILIGINTTLTQQHIEELMQFGFNGLYALEESTESIQTEQMIHEKLKASGLKGVKERNIEKCQVTAMDIVNEMIQNGNITLNANDVQGADHYILNHSVNVAILSSIIGYGMGLSEDDLTKVIFAALVHDLGKLVIPAEILDKPGRLTAEEFEIMKSHVNISYDLIKDRPDISKEAKIAVLEHHENMDGSGYPKGIDEGDISLFARILHVTDVYDALVSFRPYKKPYSPHEATEYLMGGCGMLFDKDVVEAFLKYVPLYPKGASVLTSDGREAVVIENSENHNLRPIIQIVADGTTLDLSDDRYFNITIEFTGATKSIVSEMAEKARKEMLHTEKKFNILVVEHDTRQREALKKALDVLYYVKTLKSYAQTTIYLEHNEAPDLLLIDIDVEDQDGMDFVEKINKKTKNEVPIIVMGAVCDKNTVLTCRTLGVASYIIKPFKNIFLKSEIKRILTGEIDAD